MFRKALSVGGLLLLSGAIVLVAPGFGQARGGGHGGGGHGGGGFHGGAHVGGYRGGYSHGGYYGHPYAHYGYGRYYGSYGGYGGYGVYPYYGYSTYDPYAYDGSAVTDDTGYNGSYGSETPSYSYGSYAVTPPAATDGSARVTVTVPAGARVTFDGTPTSSTGAVREFQSPPLTPGRRYSYEVRATWTENGKEVTQTQQVEVASGARASATFPEPKR